MMRGWSSEGLRGSVSIRAGDRMIAAVILVILAAVVAMGAFSLLAAERIDAAARVRGTELVRNSLERRAVSLQRDLASFAHWDESVLRTAYYLDTEWVHRNFGRWLHDTQQHDRSYIVVESGVAYASIDGDLVPPDVATFDEHAIMPVVEKVRASYLDRVSRVERMAEAAPQDLGNLQPVFESGYVRVEGRPALVGAISITPDYGRVVSPDHMTPIAVTVLFLDEGFLRDLLGELQIVKPAISDQPPPADFEAVAIPFASANAVPAWLSWQPENPGGSLIRALLPALLGTAVLLLSSAAIVLWYARRATQDLAHSEALATHLAYVDPLCGLANRAMLMRELDSRIMELENGERLAVFFLDLDGFKDINDTLGHHVGDMLLMEIGTRLQTLPFPDGVASRFGGDQFVVLVPVGPGPQAVAEAGAVIIDTVRQPMSIAGQTMVVGGTIGATLVPDHSREATQLIRLADIALYRAKTEARGTMIVFEPQMESELLRRRDIELELQRALVENELTVYYQPQFSVDGESVIGFEALVRWIHPVKGLISPAEFVPIAERTGLVTELDMMVLRRGCEQARGWGETRLAVNLSPVDFRAPDLAGAVAAILAETGFPAERLEIEITENLLFENQPEAFAALSALRHMGVRIALDDFGSGYSSLGYLRRFRVDTIKIDRSFTQNIAHTDDAAAIIDCVVRLARALAITVTAEGVETREQLRYLQSVGCHHVQGFLLAGPMPVESVGRYLERTASPNSVTHHRRQRV
ncbi:putative bifunctional diguanylate cyclase/phosphodiesterase [Ancylobacter sp. G4_0304]|uniref:putative bifunctional diguanylate cyclase/phosphodiesterase n=1 Tax=Ancylobacter sp. G4_0304 TaxID=3114289 RepID=UPI0039C73300